MSAALVAAALALACGRKGPPLPPLPRTPPAISDLEATLAGAELELAWTAGAPLDPAGGRIEHEALWKVETGGPQAPAEGPAVPHQLSGPQLEQFLSQARRAPGPAVEWGPAPGRRERRLEARAPTGEISGRARVQVAVLARSGRHQSLSNLVTIDVPADPLPAPHALPVKPEPEGVRLSWQSLQLPARLEVFRARGEAPEAPVLLARVEPAAGEFLDRTARLGERYVYAARLRAPAGERAWRAGPRLELEPITYIDSFPPAAPRGLTLLIEDGGARLLWSPNREPDLAGYRIYRRLGDGEEERVGSVRGWEVTWVDERPPEGESVQYRLTAFDSSPQQNESAPSEPAWARVRRPLAPPGAAAPVAEEPGAGAPGTAAPGAAEQVP